MWFPHRLRRRPPKAGDAVCSRGCVFVQVELQRWWPNRVPLGWVIVRGVEVDALLGGTAVVGQDGVRDGGAVVVPERVVPLRMVFIRGSTVVASAPLPRSGTMRSHVVRGVVFGGPVCPSRISVSYLVQSCSMRSTYAASVYGWILCSARVRAWASCLYRVQCRAAGLVGGLRSVRVWAPSSRPPCPHGGWRTPGCIRHLLVRVYIPGGLHPWTRWSVGMLRCVHRGPVLSCRTMVWTRVQLCRVRTRGGAVSSWVAGGGASDSWMKVRASCAGGDPAGFVQAPVLDTNPCTTTPSGNC